MSEVATAKLFDEVSRRATRLGLRIVFIIDELEEDEFKVCNEKGTVLIGGLLTIDAIEIFLDGFRSGKALFKAAAKKKRKGKA